MKQFFLLFLLIPTLALGQKFDITAQAGLSTIPELIKTNETATGPSLQLSAGYKPVKHLKINIFYQSNLWNTPNNSIGISPEFLAKNFFAGLDIENITYASTPSNWYSANHFNPSLGYGLHIGTQKELYKHLFILTQLGFCQQQANGTITTEHSITANSYVKSFSETINVWYLRLGLSVRL